MPYSRTTSTLALLGALATGYPNKAHAQTDSATARFDKFIQRAYEISIAPGFAVAVVQGDEVVYLRGFGYADIARGRRVTPETVFYIASSTKSFTGMTAAILGHRGELNLNAPLANYLPDVRMAEGLSAQDITLRNLLTHTHGINNNGPVSFRSAFAGTALHDRMVELIASHQPADNGRAFSYSNVGYNIASLAMDQTLGTGWKDVLARDIFTPLGMTKTTGFVSRVPRNELALPYGMEAAGFSERHYAKSDENMHAAGGLVTNIQDLAKWLEVNLNDGRLDGQQVIPSSAVREAHTPWATQDATFQTFTRTGYGLGWNVGRYDGDTMVSHFGGFSGFHSHVSFLPERGVGVVALANTTYGAELAGVVARYIYDVLLEKPDVEARYDEELREVAAGTRQTRERIAQDRARRASRPQTLSRPLSAYAGTYENAMLGRVEFIQRNDRLEARMGPLWSMVEVYDNTKDQLRVELAGGGSVVQFRFGAAEQAVAMLTFGMRFDRVR